MSHHHSYSHFNLRLSCKSRALKQLLCLASLLIFSSLPALNMPCIAQATVGESIKPSDTDARIHAFDDPHMVWLPQGQKRDQLLVFLPGTGGQPKERFPFAVTAAVLGYHVISLMYPDTVAAQQVCANSTDPEAHMHFRKAIIQGGDWQDIHIDPQDCIESRLIKLLLYLSKKAPNAGWDQYLTASREIDWSKIAISGQSQGGGHAYVISKIHPVARVLMFGSPKDYSFNSNQPATGFDSDTKTPLTHYFAFNHIKDSGHGCSHEQQSAIFDRLKLKPLGVIIAEQTKGDYKHAHLIYTDLPVESGNFHGSVIQGKMETCKPTWKYMLTESVD